LVRVVSSGTPFIKPVLDAGAEGIVVPQVRTADEVRGVVFDCRYPPKGIRGYGPRVPSNYGRQGGTDYAKRANGQVFVSVQIETLEAIQAIDEIAATPGLDSLVIGPWDISSSLGLLGEIRHPKVLATIETVVEKARGAGLAVGAGMGADPDYARLLIERGVQWLQVGGDCDYLVSSADQITELVRGRSGKQREEQGAHT
jgi:2-dehydro-3-deoxyglucarate aldolase/4-hydroxy-2-oxoheptanedioate aldolase